MRSRFVFCGTRIYNLRGVWANDMDEWDDRADSVRGNTDTEPDTVADTVAHCCANAVADCSANGESHAESNSVADATVPAG